MSFAPRGTPVLEYLGSGGNTGSTVYPTPPAVMTAPRPLAGVRVDMQSTGFGGSGNSLYVVQAQNLNQQNAGVGLFGAPFVPMFACPGVSLMIPQGSISGLTSPSSAYCPCLAQAGDPIQVTITFFDNGPVQYEFTIWGIPGTSPADLGVPLRSDGRPYPIGGKGSFMTSSGTLAGAPSGVQRYMVRSASLHMIASSAAVVGGIAMTGTVDGAQLRFLSCVRVGAGDSNVEFGEGLLLDIATAIQVALNPTATTIAASVVYDVVI